MRAVHARHPLEVTFRDRAFVTNALLANELVILAMGADPKPMHATWHGKTKCAVIEAYSNAMESTISNCLEMQ